MQGVYIGFLLFSFLLASRLKMHYTRNCGSPVEYLGGHDFVPI
jgi:hypothetical protein